MDELLGLGYEAERVAFMQETYFCQDRGACLAKEQSRVLAALDAFDGPADVSLARAHLAYVRGRLLDCDADERHSPEAEELLTQAVSGTAPLALLLPQPHRLQPPVASLPLFCHVLPSSPCCPFCPFLLF